MMPRRMQSLSAVNFFHKLLAKQEDRQDFQCFCFSTFVPRKGASGSVGVVLDELCTFCKHSL